MRKLTLILPFVLGVAVSGGWMLFQHVKDTQKRPAVQAAIHERSAKRCLVSPGDPRDYNALLDDVLYVTPVRVLSDLLERDITICPDPRFSLYHKFAYGGDRSIIGAFYPKANILTIDVFPLVDDAKSIDWPISGGVMLLEQFHADLEQKKFALQNEDVSLFYAVRETKWPGSRFTSVTFNIGQGPDSEDDFGHYPLLWESSYFVQ